MIMEINTLSVTNIVNINKAFIVNLTTNNRNSYKKSPTEVSDRLEFGYLFL